MVQVFAQVTQKKMRLIKPWT